MDYSTADISEAVGIPENTLYALMARGQLTPECGKVGTGRAMNLTGLDALQGAVLLALRGAKVPLKRATALWQVVAAQSDLSRLVLYVAERSDSSDTDFRLASGPARPADVPDSAAKIDVGDLKRQVEWNLNQIDARRTVSNPASFPFRFPFMAANPDAQFSVFLAREPGEPDAEAIARITDAIEVGSHILACGATRDALLSLVAVIDRAIHASAAPELVH